MSWREKLTDPLIRFCKKRKNIFFLQERVSKDGEIFKIIKFKTFFDEIPEHQKNNYHFNSIQSQVRFGYDERRLMPNRLWMRKTKFDELPRLINLIRGDLQLVGLGSLPFEELLTVPLYVKTKYIREKPGLIPVEQQYNWQLKEGRYEAMQKYLKKLENSKNHRAYKLRSGIRALVNTFFHPANG